MNIPRRINPEEPFRAPIEPRWVPRSMRVAPHLDAIWTAGPITPRRALLINPFYPKDPNASFGKHVLTPTLALTSIAGATPPGWDVTYWDENLLLGPPPSDPLPEVVGITVHLTFAKRAYELGLANRVVPADALDAEIERIAGNILGKSAVAIRMGKGMFYKQLEMGLTEAYAYAGEVMACNMMSDDAGEGIDAFTQKRKPEYKGC